MLQWINEASSVQFTVESIDKRLYKAWYGILPLPEEKIHLRSP